MADRWADLAIVLALVLTGRRLPEVLGLRAGDVTVDGGPAFRRRRTAGQSG